MSETPVNLLGGWIGATSPGEDDILYNLFGTGVAATLSAMPVLFRRHRGMVRNAYAGVLPCLVCALAFACMSLDVVLCGACLP